MSRDDPYFAHELQAQMDSNPEWVERQRVRDMEIEAADQESRRIQSPLTADLRAVGLQVATVWDLGNRPIDYPEAVPILVEHLKRDYPDRDRAGIALALAVPFAKSAYPTLVKLFREGQLTETQDGLAAAITATAGKNDYDEMLKLLWDKALGPARVFFIQYFRRHAGVDLESILLRCQADTELEPEATHWMKRKFRRKS